MPDRDTTIASDFDTRREAELAVERLVQDRGVDRNRIRIGPAGAANTAGVEADGSDNPVRRSDEQDPGPALNGRVRVEVDAGAGDADVINAAFAEFNGSAST